MLRPGWKLRNSSTPFNNPNWRVQMWNFISVERCSLCLTHGVNTRRGTLESNAFNIMGGVKPVSGVNLHDDEWKMLTFNFVCVKDALNGKKRCSQGCVYTSKRCHRYD